MTSAGIRRRLEASDLARRINARFDRYVRPEFPLGDRSVSSFLVIGCTGFGVAAVLSVSLVSLQGLSQWIMAGVSLLAVATFLATAMITKVLIGRELLIYYHHEYSVLGVASIVLSATGTRVTDYLEILALGIGVFLIFGRLGCLMVGCCHGRPSNLGVRYGESHVDAGFPWYYRDIRLLPVQLFEALGVSAIIAIALAIMGTGAPVGTALAWYLSTYALLRFGLEFLRGDADRPFRGNFSEAQWWGLLTATLVVASTSAGWLPPHPWHVVVLGAIAVSMLVLHTIRSKRLTLDRRVAHPHHVREFAELLRNLTTDSETRAGPELHLRMGKTSLGVVVSESRAMEGNRRINHYSISCEGTILGEVAARWLADLIRQIQCPSGDGEFSAGVEDVYHFRVRHPESTGSVPRQSWSLQAHV